MKQKNRHRFTQKYNFGWLSDFANLFFPKICIGCAQPLNASEDTICIDCLIKLPRTNYHRLETNPVLNKFRGRIQLDSASAFLYFARGNSTRSFLHHLKYSGRQDIGKRLGALYAKDLLNDGYQPPDVIIPLPLHSSKQRIRGFNQCTSIAEGMNKYMRAEIGSDFVKRISNNSTQTKKGRFERWENVERIFSVSQPEKIVGKNILLIDDVVTTGSTLEACGHTILEAKPEKLSFLTLATA
ncbi:MAG TPA: phosphoribosyltransferase family protein [Cryomorphaceae bacterium]|nr:phosphoribosyltransferase family protein [Cryomorphaceae bacterium]